MKLFSILMSFLLGLSAGATSNQCITYYNLGTTAQFPKMTLAQSGLRLSPGFKEAQRKIDIVYNEYKTLDAEIDSLVAKKNSAKAQITQLRKDRPLSAILSWTKNPQNIKIDSLKDQRDLVKGNIEKKIKLRDDKYSEYTKLLKEIKQIVDAAKDMKESVRGLVEQHIWNQVAQKEAITNLKFGILQYDATLGQFHLPYTFHVELFGKPVNFDLRLVVGFSDISSGSPKVFVFGQEFGHSKLSAIEKFAVDEVFKPKTLYKSDLTLLNGDPKFEENLAKRGFNLADPKIQELILQHKKVSLEKADAATKAQAVAKAAAERQFDRSSDSGNDFLYYYYHYTLFSSLNSAYHPPAHWIIHNLEKHPENHSSLAVAFHKAEELSHNSSTKGTAQSFDATLKEASPEIIGVKEAMSSAEYKAELIESGIAETLDISVDRIEMMNADRIDIDSTIETTIEATPDYTVDAGSFDGGGE